MHPQTVVFNDHVVSADGPDAFAILRDVGIMEFDVPSVASQSNKYNYRKRIRSGTLDESWHTNLVFITSPSTKSYHSHILITQ